MSLNAALNATIALIENRPAQFREMLREPSSDVKNISPVYARLSRSLDFYAATKIRTVLMAALHLAPQYARPFDPHYEDGYYDGIVAIEKLFEDVLTKLEEK
jgi:hypothetical protein